MTVFNFNKFMNRLIEMFHPKDNESLKRLYNEYHGMWVNWLRKNFSGISDEDGQDLIHDALVKIISEDQEGRYKGFETLRNLNSFFMEVLKQAAYNKVKRDKIVPMDRINPDAEDIELNVSPTHQRHSWDLPSADELDRLQDISPTWFTGEVGSKVAYDNPETGREEIVTLKKGINANTWWVTTADGVDKKVPTSKLVDLNVRELDKKTGRYKNPNTGFTVLDLIRAANEKDPETIDDKLIQTYVDDLNKDISKLKDDKKIQDLYNKYKSVLVKEGIYRHILNLLED